MKSEITRAVQGVGAEIRSAGFSWKATVRHLGGGGTDYYKFDGRWIPVLYSSIPPPVYMKLRKEIREAIRTALGRRS